MKGVLKIVTRDRYLGQKLRLELCEDFDRIEVLPSPLGEADLWIVDTRACESAPAGGTALYLSEQPRDDGASLPLPLPLGLAARRVRESETAPLVLSEGERTLRLYGETVRLTEVEFSLLRALVDARGEFVSREALRLAVWGAEGTESVLNVYIHYLREKLERGSEKVILSSRKLGYALAEKFTGRKKEC